MLSVTRILVLRTPKDYVSFSNHYVNVSRYLVHIKLYTKAIAIFQKSRWATKRNITRMKVRFLWQALKKEAKKRKESVGRYFIHVENLYETYLELSTWILRRLIKNKGMLILSSYHSRYSLTPNPESWTLNRGSVCICNASCGLRTFPHS